MNTETKKCICCNQLKDLENFKRPDGTYNFNRCYKHDLHEIAYDKYTKNTFFMRDITIFKNFFEFYNPITTYANDYGFDTHKFLNKIIVHYHLDISEVIYLITLNNTPEPIFKIMDKYREFKHFYDGYRPNYYIYNYIDYLIFKEIHPELIGKQLHKCEYIHSLNYLYYNEITAEHRLNKSIEFLCDIFVLVWFHSDTDYISNIPLRIKNFCLGFAKKTNRNLRKKFFEKLNNNNDVIQCIIYNLESNIHSSIETNSIYILNQLIYLGIYLKFMRGYSIDNYEDLEKLYETTKKSFKIKIWNSKQSFEEIHEIKDFNKKVRLLNYI